MIQPVVNQIFLFFLANWENPRLYKFITLISDYLLTMIYIFEVWKKIIMSIAYY